MSSAAKMKVKATTLYYVMCSLGNILHVYQICDEYLRYDVTTNVQVAVPDEIPFPSITLCVDLIDSLNWTAISNKTKRKMLDFLPEPDVSYMVTNTDRFLSQIKKMPQQHRDVVRQVLYGGLVKELSVAKIINASASFSDMVDSIKVTKLLFNESQLVSLRKEEKVSKGQVSFNTNESHSLQFTVDMTYIHLTEKCIVMRPQLGLQNSINYDDQISRSGFAFFSFGGHYNWPIRVHVLRHGYVSKSEDTCVVIGPNTNIKSSFVTHSSTLLEYPYKTNCRDYTKIGILSRGQCRQKCFKAIAISQFNRIPEKSYAFESDTAYLQTPRKDNESLMTYVFAIAKGNESMYDDILEQCKRTCFQRECQSLVYIQSNMLQLFMTSPLGNTCSLKDTRESQRNLCKEEEQLRKSYLFTLVTQGKPGTKTESQPVIPLISFLTGLFSTFGFWLGLSVFHSFNFTEILWSKRMKMNKHIPRKLAYRTLLTRHYMHY